MHVALKAGTVVAALSLAPIVAQAGKAEGVGIGAGVGGVIAGPPGAIVGGVIGYKVGGPDIFTGKRYRCWRDDRGRRHCARRR